MEIREEDYTLEQLSAIKSQNPNVAVTAPAGSGKTKTMIARIIYLLNENECEIDNILCSTFTEDAAGEIKERLKTSLIERAKTDNSGFCLKQLNKLNTADISTIHGICSRIIKTYFYACDLSPDFSIAKPDDVAVYSKLAIDKTFRDYYKEKNKDFIQLANRYQRKRKDEVFKKYITDIYEFLSSEIDKESFFEKSLNNYSKESFEKFSLEVMGYAKETAKGIIEKLEEIKEDFIEKCPKIHEIVISMIGIIGEVENFCHLKDFEKLNALSYDLRKIERPKDQETINSKEKFKKIKEDVDKFKVKYLKVQNFSSENFEDVKKTTCALIEAVKKYSQNFAEIKKGENVLDFNDLEYFCLKCLENSDVLEAVRKKYKYVFVDEYQDVNSVQEAIISKISNKNLFMVGDDKQSIYGFRGCNPDIFVKKADRFLSGEGKRVDLTYNFRSAQKIIDFVNKVFSYSMTEKVYGVNYKDKAPLKTKGFEIKDAIGKVNVYYLGKEKDEKSKKEKIIPKMYDILDNYKEDNLDDVLPSSKLIANIIENELKDKYALIGYKEYKKVELKDICILSRTKDNEYNQKLISGLRKHNIPVSSEIEDNLCLYPEIQTLIYLLKLLDFFKNDVALVNVLKSPIGNLTEEELYKIRKFSNQSGNTDVEYYKAFYNYINSNDDELSEKLSAFNEYVKKLRYCSDFMSAYEIVNKVIKDSNYLAFIKLRKGGLFAEDRVNRFLEFLSGENKKPSVSEVLKRLKNNKENIPFSIKGVSDCISFKTIHSSKGLERPVIILCGLDKPMNKKDESKEIILSRDLGLAIKDFNDKNKTTEETIVRFIIKERLRKQQIKEELRLLYVALTRAEYSLYLTFEGKEMNNDKEFYESNSLRDFLPPDIDIDTKYEKDFFFTEIQEEEKKLIFNKPDENILKNMQENFNAVYEFRGDVNLPLKKGVSSLLHKPLKEEDNKYEVKAKEDGIKDKTDTERGIIAHAILENIDFFKDFDGEIERLKLSHLLDGEKTKKINLNYLKGAVDKIKEIIKGYKLYKEQDFICNVKAKEVYDIISEENIVVQGVIDLLAVKDEEAIIIDYKYSGGNRHTLIERYSKQLELYSKAVSSVLGYKIKKRIIVSLISGEVIELE